MIPIVHFTHNRVLGAPRDMKDDCVALHIRDDMLVGHRAVVSHWRPTPEEVLQIVAGAAVTLWCIGETMPPVFLSVEQ